MFQCTIAYTFEEVIFCEALSGILDLAERDDLVDEGLWREAGEYQCSNSPGQGTADPFQMCCEDLVAG